MKNKKFLLDTQTKCGIADEILNAAIDAEGTFKCKWHKFYTHGKRQKAKGFLAFSRGLEMKH